jgi:putative membrane protein
MRSKRILAAAAAALVATGLSGPAAADGMLGDLEIAHAAYTAGSLDIRYAHLALALSESKAVRDFAATMIRDHSAVNREAEALIARLKVTPKDNPLSRALVKGATVKRAAFVKLSGKAFNCAYAKNELAYHRLVNKTVETEFIPAVTVAPLKALLANALATFKVHQRHAQRMVAGLGCGA